MRMTAEVLSSANAYLNPLRQSELGLRGLKIPAFENLGVTEDRYQAIDVSDNEIVKLENFPLLKRLETILASNNQIRTVARGLGERLPNLHTLVLSHNRFARLLSLAPLAEFRSLRSLTLLGCPVTNSPNYRLWVAHHLPQVTLLDFAKIKPQERAAAAKLFGGAAAIQNEDADAMDSDGDEAAAGGSAKDGAAEDADEQKDAAAEAEAAPGSAAAGVDRKQRRADLILKIRQASSLEEIQSYEQELEALEGLHRR